MSVPLQFALGQAFGRSSSKLIRDQRDQDAIEQIISQSRNAQDASTIDDLLGQVVQRVSPERRQSMEGILANRRKEIAEKEQRSRSQTRAADFLSNLNSGEGNILQNLLPALQESDLSLPELLETIQRFTPLADSIRKSSSPADEFLNRFFKNSFINQPEVPGTSLSQNNFISEETYPGSGPPQNQLTPDIIPKDKAILMKAHSDPRIRSLGDAILKDIEINEKRFSSDRKFAAERAQPYLKKIDEQRQSLRNRKFAGTLMQEAVETGDLDFWSPDKLADATGLELFRTAKGQQFKTAGKEYFLANIQRAGTRPNQWIEQQILSAMANIGSSRQAQLTAIKSQLAETALLEKEIEITDEIVNEYKGRNGFVPGDIAAIVDERMKPYAEEIQNNLAYDLRKLYEDEQGIEVIRGNLGKKVPKGTPLTKANALLFFRKFKGNSDKALKEAIKLGYRVPTDEEWRRWEE